MKNILFIVSALFVACNSSQKTVGEQTSVAQTEVIADPQAFAVTITEKELKEHLYIYASNEFEGRETGKPGQKKAVDYLKTNYEAMEIPPAKEDGSYLQKVPLEFPKVPMGSIMAGETEYELGTDFLTFAPSAGNFDEIIYVGYGIEDKGYSDYQGLDVSGKLILIKSGEPVNEDGTYVISGSSKQSVWSSRSDAPGARLQLARSKGAKGVLYYDPDNYDRYKKYFDYLKESDKSKLEIKVEEENAALVLLSDNMIKNIFPAIKETQTSGSIPQSMSLRIKSNNEPVSSENVVAVIRGFEKPDEFVVISSHLDHIGINKNGDINNGADDDGSGTVAMLEIAEAFKQAADTGNRPKRSIVFLHVTGEEKGLLGSKYYTDNDPIFPLSQTVANLNIDMIGRIDPKHEGNRNYVYLIGSDKLSAELHELSEEINSKYSQLELDYTYNDENDPNRFYYRSDHYNFVKNNIPIIFYFSGTHEDYHRPGDTPDKINYDLLEDRARLIFHTAWEIANRDVRIEVDVTPSK
ncbi:M28 family peptidase [Eudoraea sp.]|uniref:M28 family peptidase n=2 Tax=Eudoraea sp. TaxID=1979955 RepID=UPI003C72AE06